MDFGTALHDILDRPGQDYQDDGEPRRGESPPHLTPTQMKVLRCVYSGLLNKQIAYELGMAEATVKVHMTALMRKLNVRNRTQVAVAAGHLGWHGAAFRGAVD
ncbi:response regulator transcription factor [Sphingobium sp. Sx8-8]|uniref:helix-turn-helix domain-containing protein n=1 Tax=Sphingobium sp. Sx8-8 TaxID=2933617 RepID=UPI001F56D943|nr:response regulator transcription factor [Sphingobium sp. Sx8-8]